MVSVVMPAFCAGETIEQSLGALAGQVHEGPWEVIVVDDGSTDETAPAAAAALGALPGGRLVRVPVRGGASRARNLGAAEAQGDLLAFCDADDVVEPGWLAALEEAARSADLVAGGFRFDRFNDRVLRAWHEVGVSSGRNVPHGFLPHASTSNCAVRKSVFSRVGGFDVGMRRGGDMEFAWRVQVAGFRFAYTESAVVQRRLRPRAAEVFHQHFVWGVANARLYSLFRDAGMPADRAAAARDWLSLGAGAPAALTSRRRRGRWSRRLATRAGQLAGSARHRVVYP